MIRGTSNRPYFISDFINNYKLPFTFTVIRNPYDRFISSFFYVTQHAWFKGSINEFLDILPIIFNKPYRERTLNEYQIYNHTVHQYKFITVNDKIKVDMVLHLENLENEIKLLPDNLKINKNIKLFKLNKTNRKSKYLNEKLADKIYNFYEKDFVILKYNKDTWTNF